MWKSGIRPAYSLIRMKLGDVTVFATPRPAPNPFASWVLPAPRSPHRQIRSPGAATAASAAPSARVASGSWLVTIRSIADGADISAPSVAEGSAPRRSADDDDVTPAGQSIPQP